MHIYFSGIGGVGIGPLAEIAHDAGYIVSGSDLEETPLTSQLQARGVAVSIGQDGSQIARTHSERAIDLIVYTAALPSDHPELRFAAEHGIRSTKRDGLLAQIIKEKNLKLIAVSGTHGKTTTTGMLIWAFAQLGIPASYSVGATLGFAPSGKYDATSEYFIYECDEFDRNMLHFSPYLTLLTSLDHDHFDTYPTLEEYREAFVTFIEQSEYSIMWQNDVQYLHADPRSDLEAYDSLLDLSHITLPGNHVRHNAYLVERALQRVAPHLDHASITAALNSFPGTGRRFEKLTDNLYSDYGHHPIEIAATLQLARELSDDVTLVYQPHQNVRQHEIKNAYRDEVFADATSVIWLPTYLSRENPALPTLTPQELTSHLTRDVTFAGLDDDLWRMIEHQRHSGSLVLVMGAGTIDHWTRQQLAQTA